MKNDKDLIQLEKDYFNYLNNNFGRREALKMMAYLAFLGGVKTVAGANLVTRAIEDSNGDRRSGTITLNTTSFQTILLTSTGGFLTTDSNTVQHFSGFETDVSVSGNSDLNVNWTTTGTNTVVKETVTMGSNTNLVSVKYLNGSTYMENDTSPIITDGFGSNTMEIIVYLDSIPAVATLLGNFRISVNSGTRLSVNSAVLSLIDAKSNTVNNTVISTGSMSVNKWYHVVETLTDGTTGVNNGIRKIAYKEGDLITDMSGATGSAGQPDSIVSGSGSDDLYDTTLANFQIGSSQLGANVMTGRIAEVRISNIARY